MTALGSLARAAPVLRAVPKLPVDMVGNYPMQPEVITYLPRLSAPLAPSQVLTFNRLVADCKWIGNWSTDDCIIIPFPGSADTYKYNLKGLLYNTAIVGSLTGPDANGVYAGASGAYMNITGFNLSTASGLNLSQNDISVSYWPLGTGNGNFLGGTNSLRLGGITPATSAGGTFGTFNRRLNDGTTAGTTNALQPYDLITLNRNNSANRQVWVGGVLVANDTAASTTVDNATFNLLNNNNIANTSNTGKLGPFRAGKALTDAQQIQVRHAFRNYLIGMGIISSTSVSLTDSSTTFGMGGATWQTQNASKSWSFLKDGNKVRFDIRSGDYWSGDVSQDRQRSELYSSSTWGYSADVWISFTLMLPTECDVITSDVFNLVTQMHAADALTGASPPWLISLNNLGETPLGEVMTPLTIYDTVANNPPVQHYDYLYFGDRPLRRGFPYAIVSRVRMKQDGTGIHQCWINGTQVINRTDLNIGYAADVSAGAYPKMGPYRSNVSGIRTVVEIYNYEISASSLSGRVTAPLPISA